MNQTQSVSMVDTVKHEPVALSLTQIPDYGQRTRSLINTVQQLIDNKKNLNEI